LSHTLSVSTLGDTNLVHTFRAGAHRYGQASAPKYLLSHRYKRIEVVRIDKVWRKDLRNHLTGTSNFKCAKLK